MGGSGWVEPPPSGKKTAVFLLPSSIGANCQRTDAALSTKLYMVPGNLAALPGAYQGLKGQQSVGHLVALHGQLYLVPNFTERPPEPILIKHNISLYMCIIYTYM